MAGAENQLIIVVDGNRDMLEHWTNIRSSYLEKIVRLEKPHGVSINYEDLRPQQCFCGFNEEGKRVATPSVGMALVVYTFPGLHCNFVQRSGWTKDPEVFLRWLKLVSFIDEYPPNGFTSLTTAFSNTLMMFSYNGTPKTRHCIIVAASCPEPSVIPVFRPQLSDTKQANAVTLAKTFAKYSISVSVISPSLIPVLKEIYEAGKTNSGHDYRNMQLPVLLSPNFEEACVALGCIDHKQQFVQWQRERERKQGMEQEPERERKQGMEQEPERERKQGMEQEPERELLERQQQARAVATRTVTEIATAESVWCQQQVPF